MAAPNGGEPVADQVQVGADRIFEGPYREWFASQRIGLITNPTGVNSRLQPTAALLARCSGAEVAALFGPEHGFLGYETAEKPVVSTARIHSLYGPTRKPTPEMLAPLDVLIYDMQDLGARFYTYISTLFLCMQAAAESAIPLIVLDRPNPVGGLRVEGPRLDPAFRSFVGIFDVPIRYGLTPGELARFFNTEAELRCDLRVVPMRGWRRHLWFDQTGLQWISPSPDIATVATAAVYPGMCLLEGTNLSFGRGTVRPFELIGAPWVNAQALVARMNGLNLPGARFRSQAFVPGSGEFAAQVCQGLQVHLTDREQFEPLGAALHLIGAVIALHPREFSWRNDHFDRLAGSDRLRRALQRGESAESITGHWRSGVSSFEGARRSCLLYD